jgi:hypothetical protein
MKCVSMVDQSMKTHPMMSYLNRFCIIIRRRHQHQHHHRHQRHQQHQQHLHQNATIGQPPVV